MSSNDLRGQYEKHIGKVSDKWSLYLDVYENLFLPLRDERINLLEIGIQNGGSLEIWAAYLNNAKRIVGCDIDPRCGKLQFSDPRISLLIGDAGSEATAADILAVQPEFDVIIDDGSHRPKDVVRCFSRYFSALRNGGWYIVEDMHCSYLPVFEGGLFNRFSSIAFFKAVADLVNIEHFCDRHRPSELLREFSERFDAVFTDGLLQSVNSVRFVNSMCIVSKRGAEHNTLGKRIVVGTACEIEPSIKARDGETFSPAHDEIDAGSAQSGEDRDPVWEMQVARLERKVSERDQRIGTLIDSLDRVEAEVARQGHQVALLKEDLASAVRLAEDREARIAAMLSSTSWRISKPVRILGRALRRARAALR
jgi:methyltransferase family protein